MALAGDAELLVKLLATRFTSSERSPSAAPPRHPLAPDRLRDAHRSNSYGMTGPAQDVMPKDAKRTDARRPMELRSRATTRRHARRPVSVRWMPERSRGQMKDEGVMLVAQSGDPVTHDGFTWSGAAADACGNNIRTRDPLDSRRGGRDGVPHAVSGEDVAVRVRFRRRTALPSARRLTRLRQVHLVACTTGTPPSAGAGSSLRPLTRTSPRGRITEFGSASDRRPPSAWPGAGTVSRCLDRPDHDGDDAGKLPTLPVMFRGSPGGAAGLPIEKLRGLGGRSSTGFEFTCYSAPATLEGVTTASTCTRRNG